MHGDTFHGEKVNLSLLCNGARMFSGYRDDEIVMGFPLEDFIRIAESTEEKEITSALCGCIMDDIPAGAVSAIEKIGFGKGTDQFFGRFGAEIVRLYTPKAKDGKITSLTLHVPVKFKDNETASKANEKAGKSLRSPCFTGSGTTGSISRFLLTLANRLTGQAREGRNSRRSSGAVLKRF